MTTPDLRSLTSGSADFSEEIDEADQVAGISFCGHAPTADHTGTGTPAGTPTIDRNLPPVHEVKPKGSKRRLAELKASVRRLSEMVPNELERIRRRRVQWLGDL